MKVEETINQGYSVGVSETFERVTVNIPASDTNEAFTLLFTTRQAEAFAELLRDAAKFIGEAGNA